ncbi:vanadium-dependent haloperoxidase [Portibacter lacus]|uniref:Phosphatidic acid phosphatase type 2/haloperoxidase domain-containing protein n=1 Tax=Portibacter lacus TaxID=1099794 RepID=A0AA37SP61_9BACT|nr:vanadium-dependent haloperoxidase [Portibacter lacus]GLR17470.1 hypothetical protein GCM10007940_20850 [Portibacter lacus]
MKNYYLIFALILLVGACQKDEIQTVDTPASEYSHNIPLKWNQLFLVMERFTPGYKPPVSARNNAYINLIAYETIVHGSNGKYKSLAGHFNNLIVDDPDPNEEYNYEVAVNAAYERAFELFFPTAPAEQQFLMLDISHALKDDLQSTSSPEIYARSSSYGQQVAEAIYEWSAQDQFGHEAYLYNNDPTYIPPAGEGLWKPTYPDYIPALLPRWGNVRTFSAVQSVGVPPPPAYSGDSNSKLFKEAYQTFNLVNQIRNGEKHEDYWIGEFWSDDCPILTFSPAGRWISITNQVIAIERSDMLESVVAYAKVGMALSDAGVRCWGEKYRFNTLRPIDFIRTHMGAPDWNTIMCPDGSGGFYTPNFPSYPSGHATFGSSASVVLESIFGQNYNFTDRSHEGRTEFLSKPRSFNSFREMALENAYSRVPLGVHFVSDSNAATEMGFIIGQRVNELPWR